MRRQREREPDDESNNPHSLLPSKVLAYLRALIDDGDVDGDASIGRFLSALCRSLNVGAQRILIEFENENLR
jgi:hypothetical protein